MRWGSLCAYYAWPQSSFHSSKPRLGFLGLVPLSFPRFSLNPKSMATMFWETGIVVLLVFGRLTCVEPVRASSSSSAVCPAAASVADSIFQFRDFSSDSTCPSDGAQSFDLEGDEILLQRALNLVHRNSNEYVSVLFYASWCPFSRTCRPTFTILSSLFASIRHFAIEESAIRPSILLRYGVHGFPTFFLINSTTRIRYHGSRTLNSLTAFYSDVTGIKPVSLDQTSFDKVEKPSNLAQLKSIEQESCPFSWAKSPESLLRQDTYLALATTFVLLRLLYFLLPTLLACAQCTWRRHICNMSLWEHPLAYLNQAMQVFTCKRSNLQEGAINARVWASKSLAW